MVRPSQGKFWWLHEALKHDNRGTRSRPIHLALSLPKKKTRNEESAIKQCSTVTGMKYDKFTSGWQTNRLNLNSPDTHHRHKLPKIYEVDEWLGECDCLRETAELFAGSCEGASESIGQTHLDLLVLVQRRYQWLLQLVWRIEHLNMNADTIDSLLKCSNATNGHWHE